jgi:hypothetical protein
MDPLGADRPHGRGVPFKGGASQGCYEDFETGLVWGEQHVEVWGYPTAPAVAKAPPLGLSTPAPTPLQEQWPIQ